MKHCAKVHTKHVFQYLQDHQIHHSFHLTQKNPYLPKTDKRSFSRTALEKNHKSQSRFMSKL